jgi:paraquat-inducible protein B
MSAPFGAGGGAELPTATVRRRHRLAPALVWLIPAVAALAGAWVAVRAILSTGPTITIAFDSAEGLEAGKTKLKFKAVDIGEVRDITLSEDRSRVIVTAELVKEAGPLMVEDTRFWVVRPRISLGGVSGLGTLLSGSYVGVDAGHSQQKRRQFVGLEVPPIVTGGVPGRQFVLHANEGGSLDVGSPVYFRHVQVGRVVAFGLRPDGRGVDLRIFILSPYDRYVTRDVRFFHASGFDVSLDATGLEVRTESIAAILVGGIAFEAVADSSSAPEVAADSDFTLYATHTLAMKVLETEVHPYLLYFTESLRGLSAGAPVELGGIPFGEVTSVGFEYDRHRKTFLAPVQINIYPERVRAHYLAGATRLEEGKSEAQQRQLIDELVSRGLRAQLKTASLLTGQKYVALDFLPNAAPARVDWSKTPPALPTVSGGLEALQDSLTRVASNLEKVPVQAIAADLRQTLSTLTQTLRNADRVIGHIDSDLTPEAKGALSDARAALQAADRTLSTDAPLQQDLRATLRDLSKAAQSLSLLADYLERHPEAVIQGKPKESP